MKDHTCSLLTAYQSEVDERIATMLWVADLVMISSLCMARYKRLGFSGSWGESR